MRVLLFGGTFDPPHNGHIHLLQQAIRAVAPDWVVVMPACLPPHKELYKKLALSMERRLGELGVEILLDREASPENIREIAPDIIIAATGSVAVIPGFCRKAAPLLHSAEEVLRGAPVGKRVIVLGGGLVGCETAEFLAEKGHEVTVLELRDSLAPDLETRARRLLLPRLEQREDNIFPLYYPSPTTYIITILNAPDIPEIGGIP